MDKTITQYDLDDKGHLTLQPLFFKRFHIGSALKAANAYKLKGTPVAEIFQYLFAMAFTHHSMYMDMKNQIPKVMKISPKPLERQGKL